MTFKIKEVTKSAIASIFLLTQRRDIKIPKVNAIELHAAPKTHPGGVQGALETDAYQSDVVPGSVHILPSAKPMMFRITNPNAGLKSFFSFFIILI